MNLAELEGREAARDLFARIKADQAERRRASQDALNAMPALLRCMGNRTGQSYKLRALLWSLYNGKPTSLIEILGLDWQVRKGLAAVILAFGFEERSTGASFFYEAIKDQIAGAGLWAWFCEEGEA